MFFERLTKEKLEALRKEYYEGARVRLNYIADFSAPPIGTEGTVWHVDDLGTIHVIWDNGQHLGVAYGEDSCSLIKE